MLPQGGGGACGFGENTGVKLSDGSRLVTQILGPIYPQSLGITHSTPTPRGERGGVISSFGSTSDPPLWGYNHPRRVAQLPICGDNHPLPPNVLNPPTPLKAQTQGTRHCNTENLIKTDPELQQ